MPKRPPPKEKTNVGPLLPETAEVLQAICAKKNCAIRSTCFSCRGKANFIIQIFEGRADFSWALKRGR